MVLELERAREMVIKAGNELSKKGLVARTWGNISARISESEYVITPSGRSYDSLCPKDIVTVNINDGSYEGVIKPSGEKGVHAVAYKLRPEINFVIHTHQNYASALSILEESFFVKNAERKEIIGTDIPCAEYGMYASEKLINAIQKQIEKFPSSNAILMRYHGALCLGRNYESAFAVAYELEKESQEIYGKFCGGEVLPGDSLRKENKKICFDEKFDIVKKNGFLIFSDNPYTVKMSQYGEEMYPYLDDIAQIGGVSIKSVEDSTQIREIKTALRFRDAVFIKGLGAICLGKNREEAEAVQIVLEKACMAAYLAKKMGNVRPLSRYHANKDRKAYINSYSKLK